MKKQLYGRRLKRDTNARKALFRSLMREMVIHGKMKTTEAKAKAIKGELEKLVTKAKKNEEQAQAHLLKYFHKDIADRIIVDIAPKFKDRPGGYTRILRLHKRQNDNSQMVMMEWVEEIEKGEKPSKQIKKKTTKRTQSKKSTTTSNLNVTRKAVQKTQPHKSASTKGISKRMQRVQEKGK